MQNQNLNNEDLNQNYDIPTTDLSEVDSNPFINSSGVAETITAVGGVTPERFWMVFMVLLTIGLAVTLFFGGRYMDKQLDKKDLEIDKKERKIESLEKELDECPEKTLNELKLTHQKLIELQEEINQTKREVIETNRAKHEEVKKLEQIEKQL